MNLIHYCLNMFTTMPQNCELFSVYALTANVSYTTLYLSEEFFYKNI